MSQRSKKEYELLATKYKIAGRSKMSNDERSLAVETYEKSLSQAEAPKASTAPEAGTRTVVTPAVAEAAVAIQSPVKRAPRTKTTWDLFLDEKSKAAGSRRKAMQLKEEYPAWCEAYRASCLAAEAK